MAKDAVGCYIEGLKKVNETIPGEKEAPQLKLSVIA
jgi:hypothetical protein